MIQKVGPGETLALPKKTSFVWKFELGAQMYNPGDNCRFIGMHLVEHAKDCPDFPEGTITNCVTGEIIRSK